MWHWLKKARRLEWVVGLGASIGVLLIAVQGFSYHNVTTEILFIVMGIWVVVPMFLLPFFYLRQLRRRDREVGWGSPRGTPPLGRRIGVHVFLLIVALLAARIEIEHRLLPMLGSAFSMYLWNLALVCAIIAVTELSIWRRSK